MVSSILGQSQSSNEISVAVIMMDLAIQYRYHSHKKELEVFLGSPLWKTRSKQIITPPAAVYNSAILNSKFISSLASCLVTYRFRQWSFSFRQKNWNLKLGMNSPHQLVLSESQNLWGHLNISTDSSVLFHCSAVNTEAALLLTGFDLPNSSADLPKGVGLLYKRVV